ncbi:hypothetical protein ABK040_009983 [Willaertia magna]
MKSTKQQQEEKLLSFSPIVGGKGSSKSTTALPNNNNNNLLDFFFTTPSSSNNTSSLSTSTLTNMTVPNRQKTPTSPPTIQSSAIQTTSSPTINTYCSHSCSMPGCTNKCSLQQPHDNDKHICSCSHYCTNPCSHPGFCEIKAEAKYTDDGIKLNCRKVIPAFQYKHEGPCSCLIEEQKENNTRRYHYCRKKCPACLSICRKEYGHDKKKQQEECLLHDTKHGFMINTVFITDSKQKNNPIEIPYNIGSSSSSSQQPNASLNTIVGVGNTSSSVGEEKLLRFFAGQSGAKFTCESYCKILGRGHTYLTKCYHEHHHHPCHVRTNSGDENLNSLTTNAVSNNGTTSSSSTDNTTLTTKGRSGSTSTPTGSSSIGSTSTMTTNVPGNTKSVRMTGFGVPKSKSIGTNLNSFFQIPSSNFPSLNTQNFNTNTASPTAVALISPRNNGSIKAPTTMDGTITTTDNTTTTGGSNEQTSNSNNTENESCLFTGELSLMATGRKHFEMGEHFIDELKHDKFWELINFKDPLKKTMNNNEIREFNLCRVQHTCQMPTSMNTMNDKKSNNRLSLTVTNLQNTCYEYCKRHVSHQILDSSSLDYLEELSLLVERFNAKNNNYFFSPSGHLFENYLQTNYHHFVLIDVSKNMSLHDLLPSLGVFKLGLKSLKVNEKLEDYSHFHYSYDNRLGSAIELSLRYLQILYKLRPSDRMTVILFTKKNIEILMENEELMYYYAVIDLITNRIKKPDHDSGYDLLFEKVYELLQKYSNFKNTENNTFYKPKIVLFTGKNVESKSSSSSSSGASGTPVWHSLSKLETLSLKLKRKEKTKFEELLDYLNNNYINNNSNMNSGNSSSSLKLNSSLINNEEPMITFVTIGNEGNDSLINQYLLQGKSKSTIVDSTLITANIVNHLNESEKLERQKDINFLNKKIICHILSEILTLHFEDHKIKQNENMRISGGGSCGLLIKAAIPYMKNEEESSGKSAIHNHGLSTRSNSSTNVGNASGNTSNSGSSVSSSVGTSSSSVTLMKKKSDEDLQTLSKDLKFGSFMIPKKQFTTVTLNSVNTTSSTTTSTATGSSTLTVANNGFLTTTNVGNTAGNNKGTTLLGIPTLSITNIHNSQQHQHGSSGTTNGSNGTSNISISPTGSSTSSLDDVDVDNTLGSLENTPRDDTPTTTSDSNNTTTNTSSSQQPPQLSKEEEEEKDIMERENLAKELLDTERAYVTSISKIIELYYYPLIKYSNNVIAEEDRSKIFGGLLGIYQLHQILITDLEERVNNWNKDQLIGDIFIKLHQTFKLYTIYSTKYETAIETFAKYKDNKLFKNFLYIRRKDYYSHGEQLQSFLIKPIQRIPRYILLLKGIHKHLKNYPNHPDYENIQKAIKITEDVATFLNEKIKERQYFYRMKSVSDRLSGISDLIQPNRRYICEFEMIANYDNVYGEECVVFLFNDLFIHAVKSNGSNSSNNNSSITPPTVSVDNDNDKDGNSGGLISKMKRKVSLKKEGNPKQGITIHHSSSRHPSSEQQQDGGSSNSGSQSNSASTSSANQVIEEVDIMGILEQSKKDKYDTRFVLSLGDINLYPLNFSENGNNTKFQISTISRKFIVEYICRSQQEKSRVISKISDAISNYLKRKQSFLTQKAGGSNPYKM